jgi:nucleoside-diphosphate-sugar epimerase
MQIAVFGAAGKIGSVLVPELIQRGHDVRALQHSTPIEAEGVQRVEGSLTDPDAVAETVRGARVVLQMTKQRGGGVEQAVETATRGTINVLDAIRRQGGVQQYLLTSSDAAVGIGAHPYRRPIDHTTPLVSYGDYYSLGKVLEEVLCLDYHRNFAVPYTIARLSYVHQEDSVLRLFVANDPLRPGRGPEESHYSPAQKQRLGAGERFIVLPSGEDGRPLGRTLVQREDVIDGLLRMTGKDRALGQTFHLSGPGFTWDAPCEYLAGKLDLPVQKVVVPGEHSFTIDTSHTTERLGWEARFDVIAMLDAALAWRAAHRT